MDPHDKVHAFDKKHGRFPREDELREMELGNNVKVMNASDVIKHNAIPLQIKEFVGFCIEVGRANESSRVAMILGGPEGNDVLRYVIPTEQ